MQVPRFPPRGVCGISSPFGELSPITGYVPICYSPVRRSPPGKVTLARAAARLACVKHSASVQSEPGSNSSVQSCLNSLKQISRAKLYVRPCFSLCKCLLLNLSASSNTESQVSPKPPQPISLPGNPPEKSSAFDLTDHPMSPPARQTPTPIGCSVVKEPSPPNPPGFVPLPAERQNYRDPFLRCKEKKRKV